MFRIVSVRYRAGACGSVNTCCRSAPSRGLLARVCPYARKKLLLARESVLVRGFLPCERCVIGIVGRRESGHVCDVLRQRLLPVHRQIRNEGSTGEERQSQVWLNRSILDASPFELCRQLEYRTK